ncbi:MAG: hypothetical protein ACE5EM_06955, partial [Sphingomonadales bacterium]
MPFEPIYFLYGAVFLGALLLVEGLYYLVADRRIGRIRANRRLGLSSPGTNSRDVLEILRRAPAARAHGLGLPGQVYIWFDRLITHAGLTISTRRMLMIMGGLAALAYFFMLLFADWQRCIVHWYRNIFSHV